MGNQEQAEIDRLVDKLETNLARFDDRVMATAWQVKMMLRLFKLLYEEVKAMRVKK